MKIRLNNSHVVEIEDNELALKKYSKEIKKADGFEIEMPFGWLHLTKKTAEGYFGIKI